MASHLRGHEEGLQERIHVAGGALIRKADIRDGSHASGQGLELLSDTTEFYGLVLLLDLLVLRLGRIDVWD
jgi:hypothetical protein